MEIPVAFEVASLVAVVGVLVADLMIVGRRPHVPSTRESVTWVLFYIGLALGFAALLAVVGGPVPAGQFVAGWLTEYSLSVDNLFVFMLIMGSFAVPREQQQRVLMVGIILALVLRGLFILGGAAVISHFGWVFYLFGAFLLYTAFSVWREGSVEDEEYRENVVVRLAERVLPLTREYHDGHVRVVVEGRKVFTPLLIVFVAIGTTDLLFAFDSIPAIFGLTHDPFIVFTANVFALMGLRQLYFLVGGLLQKLEYLPQGLAVILGFIGVKMLLDALHTNTVRFINGGQPVTWAPEIPTWVSLVVIVVVLGATVLASWVHSRRSVAAASDEDGLGLG
jgi:tellurite resistance protein TerC